MHDGDGAQAKKNDDSEYLSMSCNNYSNYVTKHFLSTNEWCDLSERWEVVTFQLLLKPLLVCPEVSGHTRGKPYFPTCLVAELLHHLCHTARQWWPHLF